MSLGNRRHLVIVQHKTTERNDVDGLPEGWAEYCKAYCEITTAAGSESLESGQQVAQKPLVMTTHWTPLTGGITAEMLVVMPDGRQLGIRSAVNTNYENREMVLTCYEQRARQDAAVPTDP